MTACKPNEHKYENIFSGHEQGRSSIVSITWCKVCGSLHQHTTYHEIMRWHAENRTPTYGKEPT